MKRLQKYTIVGGKWYDTNRFKIKEFERCLDNENQVNLESKIECISAGLSEMKISLLALDQ